MLRRLGRLCRGLGGAFLTVRALSKVRKFAVKFERSRAISSVCLSLGIESSEIKALAARSYPGPPLPAFRVGSLQACASSPHHAIRPVLAARSGPQIVDALVKLVAVGVVNFWRLVVRGHFPYHPGRQEALAVDGNGSATLSHSAGFRASEACVPGLPAHQPREMPLRSRAPTEHASLLVILEQLREIVLRWQSDRRHRGRSYGSVFRVDASPCKGGVGPHFSSPSVLAQAAFVGELI